MKCLFMLILMVLVSSNIVLAEELSPARLKSVNKVIKKLEASVKSKSKDAIKESEEEILKIGKDALPGLSKVFRDRSKDGMVRLTAMEVGVQLKDENIMPSLLTVAKDKDDEWYHRRNAISLIGELANEFKKTDKTIDKKYIKNLEQIFNDEQNKIDIREEALIVYGKIGQNEALPVLVNKLDDSNKNIITNAVYGIGAVKTPEGEEALFQGYLRQRGTFVEGTYIWLLGKHKNKKAVPYIIESLKKAKEIPDKSAVRIGNYISALGKIEDRSAIPILKEIADNPDIRFSRLSSAEDAAIILLKFGDYETIKSVIKRIEIDARMGVGTAKRSRGAYKRITGQDYRY